jgi:hypothetical protein
MINCILKTEKKLKIEEVATELTNVRVTSSSFDGKTVPYNSCMESMYWLMNAICDPADPYAGDLKKKIFQCQEIW